MTGCSRFRLLVGLAVIRSMIIDDNNTLLDVNRGGGSTRWFKDHGLLRVSMPLACDGFCRSYQAAFQILVWKETFVAREFIVRPRFAVVTVPNGGRKLGPRDFEKNVRQVGFRLPLGGARLPF
jgi:hypothetical protein